METKRISINELKNAVINPNDFVQKLFSNSESLNLRPSNFYKWQHAVSEFHRTNDISKGVIKIIETFSGRTKNIKNKIDLNKHIKNLINYVSSFQSEGFILEKFRFQLRYNLNDQIYISGQIPLIVKRANGKIVLIFFSENYLEDWKMDIKFPFIQNYYHEAKKIPLENIEVGIYVTNDEVFHIHSFTQEEILDSIEKINDLKSYIINFE